MPKIHGSLHLSWIWFPTLSFAGNFVPLTMLTIGRMNGNQTMQRGNVFNIASLFLLVVGLAGFWIVAEIFRGKADSLSLSGVLMLPAEVLWLAVLAGTVSAIIALARGEKSRKMSLSALIINGAPAIFIGIMIAAGLIKR